MALINVLTVIEAIRKRLGLYVAKDGEQANRVVQEIILLGKAFGNTKTQFSDNEIVVSFDFKEDLLSGMAEAKYPGSSIFRKVMTLMTELFVPNCNINGIDCNPVISTALSLKMEIRIPSANGVEVARWANGVFDGYELIISDEKMASIIFTPDLKLLEAAIDFDKLNKWVVENG
jgi:hypothetical protein